MKTTEQSSSRPMPANRVATQARICAQFIVETLSHSLLEHHPADRCLRDLFQQNHQLGSRDRRIIAETLFSVLRWWGWAQKLAPEAFVKAWKEGAPAAVIHSSDWYGTLTAAWLLENRFELPSSVMFWLHEAGLYPELFENIPVDTPVLERRRYLRPFFLNKPMPPLVMEELLPSWIKDQLAPEEHIDYNQLLTWEQQRPPVWVRAQVKDLDLLRHDLEAQSEGTVKALPHERMKNAFQIRHASANLRALPAFQNGQFEIQDLASQCVALVCAPRPGEQWWDACAGGGGKSLHLAFLMQNRGAIEATDLREAKLEELKLRARRDHFCNIRMKEWKGKPIPTLKERFDGVLVDTPCSCSGTWRRTPDGRWNTTTESLAQFTALQKQLLEAAAEAVRPGGTLVYSTCSMFRCENQGIVEAFLTAHPEFILAPHDNPLDGTPSDGMTQIWPWQGDCDAMFTAKMTRRKTS